MINEKIAKKLKIVKITKTTKTIKNLIKSYENNISSLMLNFR